MRFYSLICFLVIKCLLFQQTSLCFAGNESCLSPVLSINSNQVKQAHLLSNPIAEVTKQLLFTPTKRFLPFATRLYRFYRENRKMVQLQITEGCPSKCLICTYGPHNFSNHLRHMPFKEIDKHLDILKAAGLKTVSICLDFEPFYYKDGEKDICDVMKLIHSKGLDSWIVTHGWEKGEALPRRAAEKLASLPFPVYVLLSYHVWHGDVLNNPEAGEIKQKYLDRFSEIINTLSINPQTNARSKVQLEYRYVSDRMAKFDKINKLQSSVWEILKRRFQISDKIVDYQWGIEWSKGMASHVAQRVNMELPEMFNKYYGGLNHELQNIHFSIKVDGTMYVLAEARYLEKIDIEILMGELLGKGYAVEEQPRETNEIYWYRIITPSERIFSDTPIFSSKEASLYKARMLRSSI